MIHGNYLFDLKNNLNKRIQNVQTTYQQKTNSYLKCDNV